MWVASSPSLCTFATPKIRAITWRLTPGNRSAQTTYISYNAWAIILLEGGSSTVVISPPLTLTLLIPCVGTVEGLDIGGFILERHPLHPLPHLPHQTVLESKPPVAVGGVAINPITKVTNNNPWVFWILFLLDVVVFVTIIIIVSDPTCSPTSHPA